MKKKILSLFCTLLFPIGIMGQNVALKTNVAHWATIAPNAALEIGLGKRFTLDIYGGVMPWTVTNNNAKWKHWIVQPELRFWTCEKFNGFFIGLHGMGGQFNFGRINMPPVAYTFEKDMIGTLKDNRYEGYYAGGGLSIGYQWIVCNWLNIELSIGGGYNHLWYKHFGPEACDVRKDTPQEGEIWSHNNYVGPTKGTISFVFFLD